MILPSRRAERAVRDAFVRASGGALLLPRLTVLGDLDDELLPGAFGDGDLPERPIVDPLDRTLRLMPLVERWQAGVAGAARAKVETLRYAEALGRALDLMQLYEVDPGAIADAVAPDLAAHWQTTAAFLDIVRTAWPDALAEAGLADRITARQARLDRLTQHWHATPPAHPVIAAGIASAEPAGARLLAAIARLPNGAIVLPGLATDMDEQAWDALRPIPQPPPRRGRFRKR
ncbi:MAG: hypothetical protein AAGD40_05365 [Pseudomonadota bacterium]